MDKQPVNTCTLSGRVKLTEKTNNAHVTLLTLPSPDQYSQPQTVRILSSMRLGGKDEEITAFCRPMGYHKIVTGKKPDQHGELPRYNNVDGYFSLIE